MTLRYLARCSGIGSSRRATLWPQCDGLLERKPNSPSNQRPTRVTFPPDRHQRAADGFANGAELVSVPAREHDADKPPTRRSRWKRCSESCSWIHLAGWWSWVNAVRQTRCDGLPLHLPILPDDFQILSQGFKNKRLWFYDNTLLKSSSALNFKCLE